MSLLEALNVKSMFLYTNMLNQEFSFLFFFCLVLTHPQLDRKKIYLEYSKKTISQTFAGSQASVECSNILEAGGRAHRVLFSIQMAIVAFLVVARWKFASDAGPHDVKKGGSDK